MGLTQTGSYLADPGMHTRASKQARTTSKISLTLETNINELFNGKSRVLISYLDE